MIHAVIIDDEVRAVRGLSLMLAKYVADVKVVATSTDARQGVDVINTYRPDVVFLDIHMPELNGFELLELLEFKNFYLVFTTAHQEFALKALKLNASDYLLKPIDIEELNATVARIKTKIIENKNAPDILAILKEVLAIKNLRIPLPTKNNIEYVSPEQVLYIEADSHHSTVTLISGNKETVTSSLKDYEVLLCTEDLQFLRIHHSFIVNLQYITRYLKEDGGYVVMQGKKTIPVSKQKKEEFLRRINLKSES